MAKLSRKEMIINLALGPLILSMSRLTCWQDANALLKGYDEKCRIAAPLMYKETDLYLSTVRVFTFGLFAVANVVRFLRKGIKMSTEDELVKIREELSSIRRRVYGGGNDNWFIYAVLILHGLVAGGVTGYFLTSQAGWKTLPAYGLVYIVSALLFLFGFKRPVLHLIYIAHACFYWGVIAWGSAHQLGTVVSWGCGIAAFVFSLITLCYPLGVFPRLKQKK